MNFFNATYLGYFMQHQIKPLSNKCQIALTGNKYREQGVPVMGPGGILQELRELASSEEWEATALCVESL